MRLRLLGPFEVEGVAEHDLGSRKARTVLKVLALHDGSTVGVDRLADVLWPEKPPAQPAEQIGVLVSRLRRVLGGDRIVRSSAGYAVAADWTDVRELRGLTTAAAEAFEARRVGAARAAAGAALDLVRGDLLADEDGTWVEAARATVAAVITRAHRLSVDAAAAAGDHSGAAAAAEEALARDPYDEVVLRLLMAAHLAAGRPASALAAYGRTRRRLSEDLGVPPTAETEALYGQALAAADGDGAGTAAPGPPRTAGAPAGVVGRDRELAVLDRALADVSSSASALVVVEGDAGIGKTTLVEAWSRSAPDRAVVLRGRCDELGRDLPLQPVADALADHLRMLGADEAAAVLGEEAAALAPLLGSASGAAVTVVADNDTARARIFAALVAVLDRLGDGGPTSLIIEDLHVAGPSVLAWLAFALRRLRRTLVVVTTRPPAPRTIEATHHIVLGPLDHEAAVELVGPERAADLFARSGGHPLLLAALAEAAAGSGGSADAGGEALPATLRDAVAAIADSLGDAVGTTLRVAAVLGPECDLELVAQVSATPVVEVLGHLESAARVGLIVERGDGFGFRHQLVREALEAGTGAARRALVHQQAARALAARPRPDPLEVAVHARAGGDLALASSAFVAASAAAASRFDLDAAEGLLGTAIDLDATAAAYVARARVRMGRLGLEEAAADAERAVSLGGGAPALEVAGWVAYYQRHYEDAAAFARQATARADDDALKVSALALTGRVRHGAGDLLGAVEDLTALDAGPPAVRGVADVWLALARVHQGRPADALATLARPMVDPDSLAHPWAPLHLRFTRALALGQLGRLAEGLAVSAELDGRLGREGPIGRRFVAPAANIGAWLLRWSGRVDEAADRNRRAVESTGGDLGPSADALAEGHYVALLDLADGCLLSGDLSGAAGLVDRLVPMDTWQGTMAWHQRHRLGLLRARLALADGDAPLAAALAAEVAADATQRGAARYAFLARATGGLADPAIPVESLDAAVDGLSRCAVLDGWPLVAELARARRCDRWRTEAERLAANVVAHVPDGHEHEMRRFAARVLGSG